MNIKLRRDIFGTIDQHLNIRLLNHLLNLINAAKMFVVAVNVENPELEFIAETVDKFNCVGIHINIVENIAGYRKHIGL